MTVAGLPASPSPIEFRERDPDSTLSAPTKRPPHPNQRRSVSSMKGLLPLTLTPTPSCASSRSHLPLEEGMEQRVDDYLPEVLARDLELSKSIFELRSMTSGTPIPTVTSDFIGKSKALTYPPRMSVTSPYHTASLRVQSLGAIEERSSMVSFLDNQESLRCDDATSISDSLTGTEASYDAGPPSFRMREQSIVTNATSLASSGWRPSSKCSRSPDGPRRESSWIEAESDGEDEAEVSDFNISSLSPRPPSPSHMDDDDISPLGHTSFFDTRNTTSLTHRKSHSVSGSTPLTSPQRRQQRSKMGPWRSPSLRSFERHEHQESMDLTGFPPPTEWQQEQEPQLPERSPLRPSPGHSVKNQSISEVVSHMPTKSQSSNFSSGPKDPYAEYDDDLLDCDDELTPPRAQRNTVYIRPSPPPSPLPSVQTWLHGGQQPLVLPFQGDELAKVVPLPPDVIETLRISTACFPETMLLSSSLSVETIRSYSRKVRQPSLEAALMTPPDSPLPSAAGKKSLWRRVVKRGSQSGPRSQGSSSGLQSPSSVTLDGPKPWASIKNVFGYASDYICDALYAHILAYNYISALVARNPPPSQVSRARGPVSKDEENIPKKAASLLGLSHSPSVSSIGAANRAAKRMSANLHPWGREEMMTSQPPTSSAQDTAIRNIQHELLRCIRRLIATARLMSESGSGEDRLTEMDAEDTDMLFMRSLCEIVRMSEEASYIC